MQRVLIVDGTNIFIRNYTVVPSLSSDGVRTGGIYGTLTSLGYYIRIANPDKVIVVWDGPGGSKKKRKILPYYKEGRKPIRLNKNFDFEEEAAEENRKYQQARLIQYLNNLPICQICIEDIEADDVIGYLVKYYPDSQKIIASSDKDFYQLLDERTVIFSPTKKRFVKRSDVRDEFQVHPNNFAVARAIIGDKSDNLPGVKHVGFKTAVKCFPFLTEEKTVELDEIFEFCKKEEHEKYEKFLAAKDIIEKNHKVMQLGDPLISVANINNINISTEDKLVFNPTSVRMKLFEDGINQLGNEFFRNFKLLEIKDREA